ncbi:hypothetical protein MMC14_010125, partial [Varicellaria rhodocarpa]|nr:hypothetical protein [Varicellaria rhodocarpa]
MYIFETLILATLAPALVSSSVALPAAEKRALCNADNCLNALKNHAASASAYCTSYTTSVQTATTGFPTYIPQTCGPSRVSSACSCLATTTTTTTTSTTTTTPTACSTPTGYYGDNYVSNPDFYGIMQDQTLAPWVITNEEGSPGCNYVRGYVWGCQTCGSAEDPDA